MAGSKIDRLVVEYDYFAEDDIAVLSVVRDENDEAINMFQGDLAKAIYEMLKGENTVSYSNHYNVHRILMTEGQRNE